MSTLVVPVAPHRHLSADGSLRFSFMQLRPFSGMFNVILAVMGAGVLAGFLTGCSASLAGSHGGASGYEGQGFSGKALVGQQPLIGASVQLYSAGTSGNGSSGNSLLSNALITDSTGSFFCSGGVRLPPRPIPKSTSWRAAASRDQRLRRTMMPSRCSRLWEPAMQWLRQRKS